MPRGVKRFLRRLRGEDDAKRAEPHQESLVSMFERIRRSPLDAVLCYELGVTLLRQGSEDDGLRYLDRAFRLDALNIVRFVEAPELKQVRMRDSVVRLLTRVHREEEARSYRGYA